MDSTPMLMMGTPEPVPWYKSEEYGRAIAIVQAAILAWIGGSVFEIAVSMGIKEFGLMPSGTPKTPLGMLMGGLIVLLVTLGSLFVGTRLAMAVPSVNGVSIGSFDYTTLGIAAALSAQDSFNLSEYVTGVKPANVVKGKRHGRLSKKMAARQAAMEAAPPVPPVGATGPMQPPMNHQGPPPPMQTNPNATKMEAERGQTSLSSLPNTNGGAGVSTQGSAMGMSMMAPEASAASAFGVSLNDAYSI